MISASEESLSHISFKILRVHKKGRITQFIQWLDVTNFWFLHSSEKWIAEVEYLGEIVSVSIDLADTEDEICSHIRRFLFDHFHAGPLREQIKEEARKAEETKAQALQCRLPKEKEASK